MQNAKCKMQNAKCKMQNAKCKIGSVWMCNSYLKIIKHIKKRALLILHFTFCIFNFIIRFPVLSDCCQAFFFHLAIVQTPHPSALHYLFCSADCSQLWKHAGFRLHLIQKHFLLSHQYSFEADRPSSHCFTVLFRVFGYPRCLLT